MSWKIITGSGDGSSASFAANSESEFDIAAGPSLTPKISGIVGLCITSILWVIASWRLLYHYSACGTRCKSKVEDDDKSNYKNVNNSNNFNSNNHAMRGLTTKRILHALLWLAMVVEGVGYADMVGTNSSNKLNYTLLDIIGRGILEYWTFVIGTVHWFNVISQSTIEKKLSTSIFPAILLLMSIVVTFFSTFEAVKLLGGGYSSVDEFRETSRVHRYSLIVEAVGWGIQAIINMIASNMVYKRVSSLPTISQVRSTARRNIINKMIIPMIFCSLSYALRSGFMAADFASRIVSPETTFEIGVGWWVGNCWIPTFIPSIMLLYSIRKRDREDTGYVCPESPLLQQSLHDTAIGEALGNPFESFQQTFADFEDEDSTHDSTQPSHDSTQPSR